MKKLIKTFLTVGATLALMLVGTIPAFAYAAPNADVQRILDDTNAARVSNGLPALALNEQMTSVAQNWSQEQASAGAMAHNPDYSTQIPNGWTGAAENVAYGYAVSDVTNGWLNSPGHKANILGDYTTIGIGVQDGYFTQVFAKYPDVPQATTAPPPPAPSPVTPAPSENPQPVVTAPTTAVEPTSPVETATPPVAITPEPAKTTEPVTPLKEGEESAKDNSVTTNEVATPPAVASEEIAEVNSSGPNYLLIGSAIGCSVLLAVAVFFLVRILRRK